MFNPSSSQPPSSRTMFAATGMGRATLAAAGIVTFCAERQLCGLAVLTNDPSGGPGM